MSKKNRVSRAELFSELEKKLEGSDAPKLNKDMERLSLQSAAFLLGDPRRPPESDVLDADQAEKRPQLHGVELWKPAGSRHGKAFRGHAAAYHRPFGPAAGGRPGGEEAGTPLPHRDPRPHLRGIPAAEHRAHPCSRGIPGTQGEYRRTGAGENGQGIHRPDPLHE